MDGSHRGSVCVNSRAVSPWADKIPAAFLLVYKALEVWSYMNSIGLLYVIFGAVLRRPGYSGTI